MLADPYDAFLFDLDGVLYRGDDPIPHAAEAVARLREMGKHVAFVTNNSSRTPASVAERLRAMGIAADPEEVETSALATAELLASRAIRSAFVVGEAGILEALAEAGIEVVGAEDPRGVDAVVVGLDRAADYAKLRDAAVLVERGVPLVGTNPDPSFPAEDGSAWPGAGALLASIETTAGIEGERVGKPHPPLLLAALRRSGGEHPLVVGDRLDTDIAGAAGVGWDSLLVLTGISTREEATWAVPAPTHVGEDLRVLFTEPALAGLVPTPA